MGFGGLGDLFPATDETQRDKRYKVVVKHYRDGVLHIAYSNDLDTAKKWLFRRWAALPVNLDMVETYCAAVLRRIILRAYQESDLKRGVAILDREEKRTEQERKEKQKARQRRKRA